tara:strand:- start:354 stop:1193 length:840 start_codon:yes stop_codon:yes gene_type:complete
MPFWSDGSIPSGLSNNGQHIEFFHLVSGTSVAFRAFVTQFEDKFSSDWNTEEAFGRMDPISTFKRTTRNISLGWEIIAEDSTSAAKNLEDISKLIRMLYPSYNTGGARASGPARPSTTHISGPPLLKLKFMNLIRDAKGGGGVGSSVSDSGLLGYVDGFTHAPILDEGFIETSSSIFPKAMQMSCTFTVLHTHDIGWDQHGVWLSESDYPYKNTMTDAQQATFDDRIVTRTEANELNVADEINAVSREMFSARGLGPTDFGEPQGHTSEYVIDLVRRNR